MADLDSYIFVPTQQSKRFLALNNAQDPAFETVSSSSLKQCTQPKMSTWMEKL